MWQTRTNSDGERSWGMGFQGSGSTTDKLEALVFAGYHRIRLILVMHLFASA